MSAPPVTFLRARLDEDETAARDGFAYGTPARVLREIEAKRRIVTMYEEARASAERLLAERAHAAIVMAVEAARETLAEVIRVHATIYSEHPDFPDRVTPDGNG